MARSKGRAGRFYCRLRDQIRAISRVCWICGHAIDLTLSPRHPLSWTLDHLMPLSKGGDPLDPANARSAHYRCNSGRGNPLRAPKPTTSRRW
ncbi:HNH endonuclease [Streptosporangium sp. NPDC006007]|uniref:HNH endonuclease n=1 Tax=Streptosporangium sp. NPDC006007 TaxID=3154575 RepID=UPI0033AD4B58